MYVQVKNAYSCIFYNCPKLENNPNVHQLRNDKQIVKYLYNSRNIEYGKKSLLHLTPRMTLTNRLLNERI